MWRGNACAGAQTAMLLVAQRPSSAALQIEIPRQSQCRGTTRTSHGAGLVPSLACKTQCADRHLPRLGGSGKQRTSVRFILPSLVGTRSASRSHRQTRDNARYSPSEREASSPALSPQDRLMLSPRQKLRGTSERTFYRGKIQQLASVCDAQCCAAAHAVRPLLPALKQRGRQVLRVHRFARKPPVIS